MLARDFVSVRKSVLKLIENKILVGHSVKNDLKVLNMNFSDKTTRDISMCFSNNCLKGTSLKNLIFNLFDIKIQNGEHSSVEDALATMAVFRFLKPIWQKNDILPILQSSIMGELAAPKTSIDHISYTSKIESIITSD